jgi:hypothetical protein
MKPATKPKPTVQEVVDAMVNAAVSDYYNNRIKAADGQPRYLHYKPSTVTEHGALAWLTEAEVGPGWTLADPRAERGFRSRDELARLTRQRAGRLPILCGLLV